MQDSLASPSIEPRCPGLSALLGIKHLTLLETTAVRSPAAGPLFEMPRTPPQPSMTARPLQKAAKKGEMQGMRDFLPTV